MTFQLRDAVKYSCAETEKIAGRFYGPVGAIGVGAGIFLDPVVFPVYNPETKVYQAYEGTILILTHECDLEQGNDKVFNSDLIFAPVGKFEEFFGKLTDRRDGVAAKAYIGDLVRGRISQLFYLPPADKWPSGGIVYLNRIANTHLAQIQKPEVKALLALSGFGYDCLGRALQTHLLRPKDDRLPLTYTGVSF